MASRLRRVPRRVGNSGSVPVPPCSVSQPPQDGRGGGGERGRAVLAALAVAGHVRASAEDGVADGGPVSAETRRPAWAPTVSSA